MLLLDTNLNSQLNQIRLCKKSYDKLRAGDEEIQNKLFHPIPKYSTGFMVAAGLSAQGINKLVFC